MVKSQTSVYVIAWGRAKYPDLLGLIPIGNCVKYMEEWGFIPYVHNWIFAFLSIAVSACLTPKDSETKIIRAIFLSVLS